MSLNTIKKSSKSSRRGEFFSNNGANHDNAALDNKNPMRLTWDALVVYCRGYNWNTNRIWLINSRNLDRVPSNIFGRLTLGYLIDSGTGWRTCWLIAPPGFWGAVGTPTWSCSNDWCMLLFSYCSTCNASHISSIAILWSSWTSAILLEK